MTAARDVMTATVMSRLEKIEADIAGRPPTAQELAEALRVAAAIVRRSVATGYAPAALLADADDVATVYAWMMWLRVPLYKGTCVLSDSNDSHKIAPTNSAATNERAPPP